MAITPASLTLTRDGVNVHPPYILSNRPYLAGDQARTIIAGLYDEIEETDVILACGRINFGRKLQIDLPSCTWRSNSRSNPARWYTECMIDGTTIDGITKASATPGICLNTFNRFEGFYFGGTCWNIYEDGGLMGWKGSFETPGELELVNCEVDASRGHDWGIYSWENTTRSVTMTGGIGRYCRMFVALSASGGGAAQTIELDGVRLYGDANGSRSQGESSGPSPVTGGMLTAALNRAGTTTLTDCEVDSIGLTALYDGGAWGCPRIAALGTNIYYTTAGATTWTFTRCISRITPNTSTAYYDLDIGYATGTWTINYDDDAIADARGGTNADGTLKDHITTTTTTTAAP
jgi:hypothetical protein